MANELWLNANLPVPEEAKSMSVLSRLFSRKDPREVARAAYDRIVALGRDPYWYIDGQVEDSVDGRFEAVTMVLAAVLLRLEHDDADAEVRQFSVFLAELFVDDMDGQLRQNGVGDLVVGKHIGKMMSALGGRLGAYREALASGSGDQLGQALRRNLYRDAPVEQGAVTATADHLAQLYAWLRAMSAPAIMQGAF